MKASSIFWGGFLVFLGIFFLLDNFDILQIYPGEVLKLWPLLLIVWGVALLKIPNIIKAILAALSGFFLAVLIISLFNIRINDFVDFNINDVSFEDLANDSTLTLHTYSETYPFSDSLNTDSNRVTLNLSAGGGRFIFKGYTYKLVEVRSANADTEVLTKVSENIADVDIEYGSNKIEINSLEDLEQIGNKRIASVKLHKDPLWYLQIESGASKIDLDLIDKKVRELSIDAGVSDISIKLGDRVENVEVDLETGVSNIRISIPNNSGCRINSTSVLTSKKFKDFHKTNGNTYETNNFEKAQNKIYISLEGALSDIEVVRY